MISRRSHEMLSSSKKNRQRDNWMQHSKEFLALSSRSQSRERVPEFDFENAVENQFTKRESTPLILASKSTIGFGIPVSKESPYSTGENVVRCNRTFEERHFLDPKSSKSYHLRPSRISNKESTSNLGFTNTDMLSSMLDEREEHSKEELLNLLTVLESDLR